MKGKEKNPSKQQQQNPKLKFYFPIDLQALSSLTLDVNLVCFPVLTSFLFCDNWLK